MQSDQQNHGGLSEDNLRQHIWDWLRTNRSRQFHLVSPGVIAYIVEEAIAGADAETAQRLAGEMLAFVATVEQCVPLSVEDVHVLQIPDRLIELKQQRERLLEARDEIESCQFLTRRIRQAEADVYADRRRIADPAMVFPDAVEGAKAFALDRAYRFTDAARNRNAGDYAFMLKLRLTRTLKDFLIKYLWINVYKVAGRNYIKNPQIKYENRGYTVLIPKDAWHAFWDRVETFEIYTAGGNLVRSSKDLQASIDEEWRVRQLVGFHQIAPGPGASSKPLHDYSDSYIG
jgi:hypothetical protein